MKKLLALVLIVVLLGGTYPSALAQEDNGSLNLMTVSFGAYNIQVPNDWFVWVYDPAASENSNETNLLETFKRVDSIAASDSNVWANTTANIPGYLIVAIAPQLVAGNWQTVTLSAYDLLAAIEMWGLDSDATDEEMLLSLGGITIPIGTGPLPCSYWLQQEGTITIFSVIYIVRQQNTIVVVTTAMDSQAMGGQLNLDSNQAVIEAVSTLYAKPDVERLFNIAGSLTVSQFDLSQCLSAFMGDFDASASNTSQGVSMEYTVGVVSLAALFPDPAVIETTNGLEFVLPILGYIGDAACPDLYFTATPCPDPQKCSVAVTISTTGNAQPTLVVLQPDGQIIFDFMPVEVRTLTVMAKPSVVNTMPEGIYQIWLGGYYPDEVITVDISVVVQ